MPFKNPFFFSKRAVKRIDKIKEQNKKESDSGPRAPVSVNNFTTSNKTTIGESKNVYTPKAVDGGPGEKTKEVNNFEVNKPMMATSLNEYPAPTIRTRDIQDIIPAVNGKAAPQLVHKPEQVNRGQDYFPVVERSKKKKTPQRETKKKTS